MKTITQLTDNMSIRALSSYTKKELREIIIEASKQAYEVGVHHGIRDHIAMEWGEDPDTSFEDYLKNIDR